MRRMLGILAIGAGLFGLALTVPAADAATESVEAERPVSQQSFELLSATDRALYRDIFSLQVAGKWQDADRLIKQLDSDMLIGHVLEQRYMHPTKYRSKYSELSGWMKLYADHPGANRVYRLALKRRSSGSRPTKPVPLNGNTDTGAKSQASASPTKPRLSRDDRAAISSLEKRIRREVRRGDPDRAEKYLWAFERRGLLEPSAFDSWLATVAISHYHEGNDEKSLALASYAAERSRHSISQPDWVAGLAAWRLGDCNAAASHFKFVAENPEASEWIASAGAFWTARALLRCHQPDEVEGWLLKAAAAGDTFYALLAKRQLGLELELDWQLPELSEADYAGLALLPGVRRAVALSEVGQHKRADDELRLVWGRQGRKLWKPLIALAAHLNLPATQLSLSRQAPPGKSLPHSVRYPVPNWAPEGGFEVDRAIFFALMRQESAFLPAARSYVGAVGLMQLMPATASFLERDRSLRWSNKWKLYDPEFNMRLSQDNIQMLMGYEMTEDNLFKFATAYNGGPGNLSRWDKKMKYGSDPLLFIESVPAPETRNFIEKVFANLWIYRDRLGQPSPSLDAVASGAWPPFEMLDHQTDGLALRTDGPVRHAGH